MQALQTLADTLQHPVVNNPITQTVGGTAVVASTLPTQSFTHLLVAAVVSTVAQVVIKFLPSLLSKLLNKNVNSSNNQDQGTIN